MKTWCERANVLLMKMRGFVRLHGIIDVLDQLV